MSGNKLQVTLSATDQITPTTKTIIASLEQFLNQLKLTDAGLTGIQGKMRTAFAATGATQLFPTQQIQQFSAGLNQAGLNLDTTGTKIAGTSSKFAAFGQTLMANGTAFGVAGASAFGLFNAIDNLEKVQLRASTSTLRASTATTALTQAENALATAKASGTATTEQIAILELRVSDARERVSVTTERAAIFQQDYTEALAGLALQVGPQAIALGGSLAQVYTVLNATFAKGGGAINILKTAFAALMGTEAATTAGTLATSGAIRTIGTAAPIAATGVRTLSTAMKGLLIGTGVGAILAIGGAIAEMALTMQDASAATSDFASSSAESLGEAGGSVKDFETSWQQSMKNVETQAQNSGSHIAMIMQKIADDTKQSLDTVKRETLQNMVDTKQLMLKSAQDQLKNIPQSMNLLDAFLSGKGLPEEQRAKLTKVIDEIKADLKTLEPQLQSTTDQFTAMWLGSNTGANLLLGTLSLVDRQMLMQSGSTGVVIDDMKNLSTSAKDTAASIAGPWVAAWHKGTISMDVAKLAVTNIIKEFFGLSKIPMDLLLGQVNELFKEGAKSSTDYAAAVIKATEAQNISVEEAAKQAVAMQTAIVHNDLMVKSLAGRSAQMTSTIAQDQAFNDIIVAGIAGLNEQTAAILTRADANKVGNQQVMANIAAAGEEVIAMTNLGQIYDGSAVSFLELTKAKVAGVTSAQAFVTQAELEATTLEANTAALQEFITVNEGVQIPPWITVTPELLKKMQTEIAATGGAFGTLADAMNEAAGPALASIDKIVNAESMKELKKAFKDLPGIEDFSKNTRNALLGIEKDMNTAQKRFKEFGTDWNQLFIGITRGAGGKALADLAANMKKDFESFSKIDVTGLTKVFDPVMEFLDGLSGTQLRTEGPKLAGVVNDIMKAFESGQTIDWQEMNQLIIANADAFALFPDIFSKIVAEGNPSAQAIEAVNTAAAKLFALQPPAWINDPQKNFLGLTAEQLAGVQGKDTKKDEGATVVPAPTKAPNFDQAKQAIIDEVKTMFTKDPPPPAIIPPPDSAAFATAMNDLLLIPADFTQRFNTAFTALIIPAPNVELFANAMNVLLLIPADFTARFNTAFTALTVPAPITAPFVTGIGAVSAAVVAVATDMGILSTPLVIPAPETSGFSEAFDTLATDAVESLQEIVDFVADDLTTSFNDVGDNGVQVFVDAVGEAETTVNESLQEIVDFLSDDLTTAFEDMQSAAESAAEGAANAMDDIISAAQDAEGEIQNLISAINNIPTRVDITIFVGLEGPGVAFLAGGYHGIVDEPTLLVVGEAGAERVDVSPATGPASDNLFIQGNDQRTGITNPLLAKDTGPIGMPLPYTQPPVVVGPQGPMVANITIPVYVNGQYQGTQQTTKILRDMGAFLA